MKRVISRLGKLILILFIFNPVPGISQSGFNPAQYLKFLEDNKNLEGTELISRFAPDKVFYSGIRDNTSMDEIVFLDSIVEKYELTKPEMDILMNNHFLVSERLSFDKITPALDDIFQKDLPVFVSTDAILHALHISYGNLLRDIEIQVLEPELKSSVYSLYEAFPRLVEKYGSDSRFQNSLADVDLYITIAKSLIDKVLAEPIFVSNSKVTEVWDAIQSEGFLALPLFTDISRNLDFSQFTIRGHYAKYEELHGYFKCMIWLGRMEFVLAEAPKEWYEAGFTEDGLKRLNIDAFMLDELMNSSSTMDGFSEIDRIISFMVGESDNLKPFDYSLLIEELGITEPGYFLVSSNFGTYQSALVEDPEYQQKILSGYMKGTPESVEATPLPVSYRLLGQRFIIDSYIFYKLVYDNVVYNDTKVCRMMPDPLDAMFALGNDNALPLFSDQLETWKYSSQLAGLRYLVDAFDADFWDESLYNNWLQAIRLLNPKEEEKDLPLFMNTVAWQQQKLNTQLASWTQLRHDNLLYAKQSYTHGGECMFPHSYVEPYPAFYRQIASFAEKAETFDVFDRIRGYSTYQSVGEYFEAMKNTMYLLEGVAQKELDGIALSEDEKTFLGNMLIEGNVSGPEFNGWYVDLLYDSDGGPRYIYNPIESDHLIADVHTQPTDCAGNFVGKVLHVGVGKVNLGIFIAESPTNDFRKMAYVGPVMSYYETITNDFERLTDEKWTKTIDSGNEPLRPDWVNVYLADKKGNKYEPGRELNGELYTGISNPVFDSNTIQLTAYPNPFSDEIVIDYTIPASIISGIRNPGTHEVSIFNIDGKKLKSIISEHNSPGNYKLTIDLKQLPGGVYFVKLRSGNSQKIVKTLKLY